MIISLLFVLVLVCQAQAQFMGERHNYVEYIVSANHVNRTYKLGEKAIITIQAYKGGIPIDGINVRYSYGNEMVLSKELNDSTTFRNGIITLPVHKTLYKKLVLWIMNDNTENYTKIHLIGSSILRYLYSKFTCI